MTTQGAWRPTRIEVDLAAVRANIALFKERLPRDTRLMAVVKADAYGHGAVPVARAALAAGAERLGVALLEEAEELRGAGLDCPVHLLFEPPPRAAPRVVELRLVSTVYTAAYARALAAASGDAGRALPVHVKVDTGMHRVGVGAESALELAKTIGRERNLELEGLYTHLAMASDPDSPMTRRQLEIFLDMAEMLRREGLEVPLLHAAASGAAISHPHAALSMVRLGISMYGCYPSEAFRGRLELKPAMSVKTEIGSLTRVGPGEGLSYGWTRRFDAGTTVAVLPIGYADGLPRAASNKLDVLIGGRRHRQVGNICMDLCMVDLDGDDLEPGSEVVVIGAAGSERIGAEEVAERAGTINYEILCGFSRRIPRFYSG
ncbi:MAG: alanine racemase [Candidatus Geothermincolia bacterium]